MMFVQNTFVTRTLSAALRLRGRLRPLLRGQERLMAGLLAVWVVPAILYSFLAKVEYTATAVVCVSPASFHGSDSPSTSASVAAAMDAERQWVVGLPVLSAVAARRDISSLASFESAGTITQYLAENLRVIADVPKRSLSISVDATRPEDAAAIVNAVADEYASVREQFQPSPEADHLKSERAAAAAELAAKSAARVELLHGAGAGNFDSAIAAADAAIRQLRESVAAAQLEQADAQSQLVQASAAAPNDPEHQKILATAEADAQWTITSDADAARAREEIQSQVSQLSQLSQTQSPFSPAAASLNDRIDRMRAAYVVACRRRCDADAARLATLQISLEAQTRNINDLTTHAADLNRLDADIHRFQSQLDELDRAITAAIIAAESDGASVTILSRATDPISPSSPHRALVIFCGLVLGGFTALAGAQIRVGGRPQFASRREVENGLGLPILGTAAIGDGSRNPLAADDDSPLAASYRRMAEVLSMGAGGDGLLVLVASASTGEGRSTLAVNLAAALARSGRRTLLIDADLRSPRLHEIFAVDDTVGLVDALLEPRVRPAAIVGTDIAHLHVMSCGGRLPVPEAILNSPNLLRVIVDVRRGFEAVVFDSPALEYPEMAVLSGAVEQIVFVLDPHLTDRVTARAAVDQLHRDGATVAGVVLVER
jgi:capsular exopolysaccharide synthesis family protein